MAAKAWDTPTFKALLSEWNEKLYQTGFEDHETQNGSLKQRATNAYRQASRIERETRLQYYLSMGHGLHKEELPQDICLVLRNHVNGVPLQKIAQRCNLERKTVGYIIRRYQHEWGIRYWNRKQMKLR